MWKISLSRRQPSDAPWRERRLYSRRADPEVTAFIDHYTSLADAALKPDKVIQIDRRKKQSELQSENEACNRALPKPKAKKMA